MSDKETWQAPKGYPDYLPDQEALWRYLRGVIERRTAGFGFGRLTTPLFEKQLLFSKILGEKTDKNAQTVYTVELANPTENSDDSTYVLQPTPIGGMVRAYLEHDMASWNQPVKLWYLAPVFGATASQAEVTIQQQAGLFTFGDVDPTTDAMMIYYLWQILSDLKLTGDLIVNINTTGCQTCRAKYRKILVNYYQPQKGSLCKQCQGDLSVQPIDLLACQETKCIELKKQAPSLLDYLCIACREHFRIVLESIDELGVAYDLNPHQFPKNHTGYQTVFEVTPVSNGASAQPLASGGRFDGLVERLGGRTTPIFGCIINLDPTTAFIASQNFAIPPLPKPDLYVIQLGERAKKSCYNVIAHLGHEGLSAVCQPNKDSLKTQLQLAENEGVRFAIIVGQREAIDGTVILRDMLEGTQETLSQLELVHVLKARLQKQVLSPNNE